MSEDRLISIIYKLLETKRGTNIRDCALASQQSGTEHGKTRISKALLDLEALGLAEVKGRYWFKTGGEPPLMPESDEINDFFLELNRLIGKYYRLVPREGT